MTANKSVLGVAFSGIGLCIASMFTIAATRTPLPSSLLPDHEIQKLLPDQPALEAWFGTAVAIDNDTVVVGCPLDCQGAPSSGSAFLFRRDDRGSWKQVARLSSDDPRKDDLFGSSVAVSHNRALIGICGDGERQSDRPAAYLFQDNGSGHWRQIAKLTPDDLSTQRVFDVSVALDDEIAVVGVVIRTGSPERMSGAAYLFQDDGRGIWRQVAKLESSAAAFGNFGTSVAVSGGKVLVGASFEDAVCHESGAAYLFDDDGYGTWKEIARLSADDGGTGDCFGICCAISGDCVLVGACGDDELALNSGSAYVFQELRHGDWRQVAKLTPDDAAAWDSFGCSVAMVANVAVVGSPGNGDQSGAVYQFYLDGKGAPKQVAKFTPSHAPAQSRFARSIASSGKTFVAGAAWDDDAQLNSGAAFMFQLVE